MELNSRELALVIWTGIVLLALLLWPQGRSSLLAVVRTVFQRVILVPLALFSAYVGGLIFLASRIGLWDPDLVNDAVLWFIATGLVLFFNMARAFERDDFFKRSAVSALKIGVLVEVFVNVYVLPFPVEFILLPFISVLAMMSVVAASKEEFAPVRRFIDGLMGIVGTVIMIYVAVRLAIDLDHFDPAYGAKALALPIWLTLGSLPFIYGLGLYAAYDKAFTMISFHAENRSQARRAKLALMLRLHLRARLVGEFNMPWQHQLLESTSFRAAWRFVGEFIREQKRADALAMTA